jgi:hypothetical protein
MHILGRERWLGSRAPKEEYAGLPPVEGEG